MKMGLCRPAGGLHGAGGRGWLFVMELPCIPRVLLPLASLRLALALSLAPGWRALCLPAPGPAPMALQPDYAQALLGTPSGGGRLLGHLQT
jgi:hypothetical protein